jgi:hypothetical protein
VYNTVCISVDYRHCPSAGGLFVSTLLSAAAGQVRTDISVTAFSRIAALSGISNDACTQEARYPVEAVRVQLHCELLMGKLFEFSTCEERLLDRVASTLIARDFQLSDCSFIIYL